MEKDSADEPQPRDELPSIAPGSAEVARPGHGQTPKRVDLRRAKTVTPKVIPVSGEDDAEKHGGE